MSLPSSWWQEYLETQAPFKWDIRQLAENCLKSPKIINDTNGFLRFAYKVFNYSWHPIMRIMKNYYNCHNIIKIHDTHMCHEVYYYFLKLLPVHFSFHLISPFLHPRAASPYPLTHCQLDSHPQPGLGSVSILDVKPLSHPPSSSSPIAKSKKGLLCFLPTMSHGYPLVPWIIENWLSHHLMFSSFKCLIIFHFNQGPSWETTHQCSFGLASTGQESLLLDLLELHPPGY